MTGTTTLPDSPSRTLGAFLRRMRDRASPPQRGTRRRAVGLRREEVAAAADIGVSWYTWLEQGRPVRVSRRTLAAIARALHLSAAERAHLMRLADAAANPAAAPRFTTVASPLLRDLVRSLAPHPAYAVNGYWDVLCANDAATRLFGAFDADPGRTDNVLARLFLDPAWRALFHDWSVVAESAVAQFRAATGHLLADDTWRGLVDAVRAASPEFASMWDRHDLAEPTVREKSVQHPERGRLRFVYASIAPDGEPADVRVVTYMPADQRTAAVVRELS
jgi:transcriptional regulator with XRE-family HTH domain